jgi:SAM-dependent methyltransferase
MARLTECRSCGSSKLVPFLDLGDMPVINNLPQSLEAKEPKYQLGTAFCPACNLVQLTTEVDENEIFNEDYPYFSSFAESLLVHSKKHVDGLLEWRKLSDKSLVVELASNDGYLLQYFQQAGVPVLGIDPSPGPAKAAIAKGIPTRIEFFTQAYAQKLVEEGIQADVIIANNVMAHIPDLNGFMGGMATLIKDDGVITVENPYLRDMVEKVQFDTVYHEHYFYHCVTGVNNLAKRHGLTLFRVTYHPDMHGGTLRYHLSKTAPVERSVVEYLEEERRIGMTSPEYFLSYGQRVQAVCNDLRKMLSDLKSKGKRVVAYGAAAKGAILLNSAKIGPDLVEYVIDKNPAKQNRYMPGVQIPIVGPEKLQESQPDYMLILIWNFKDEVMRQQAEFARKGGKFIVGIPTPLVLEPALAR